MKQLSIPVGVSDFKEIRQNGYYYVDKTALIGELLKTTATKVTLITRPRRFGKTLAMSMLANFFDIGKRKQHLYLLDSDKLSSYDKESMNRILSGKASVTDIKGSLLLLTGMLQVYYGKPVILLIDE